MFLKKSAEMPDTSQVISGRAEATPLESTQHYVSQHEMIKPWPVDYEQAMFGMGCFWGAERLFWKIQGHDPTQVMRQGNDVGTQYRSGIYTYSDAQQQQATASMDRYQSKLDSADYEPIATEIKAASQFYYAESAHQQYLANDSGGYCGLGGTGVSCAG